MAIFLAKFKGNFYWSRLIAFMVLNDCCTVPDAKEVKRE